jgi:hypothetical protein
MRLEAEVVVSLVLEWRRFMCGLVDEGTPSFDANDVLLVRARGAAMAMDQCRMQTECRR